ncbi:RNA polymerase sigma-70 factor [Puia sp.]|jgi:RNA polymerase sigma-70 factor (ECF subfamily)|uniref:RNA polymerase sigma factor n=1 Tax=Puia sp. TaxID=2045100 RepID=UPI002F3FD4A9
MPVPPDEQVAIKQTWQLLAEGSEYAFTQLFDHYRGKVYSVAWHFLKSPVLAEEIVQDVFMKIWLKRQDLQEIQNTENYLFILARNLIFDRLKALSYETAAQKKWPLSSESVDDSDHRLRQDQCLQLLRQAVDLLPQRQKEVYRLAKMQGLSQEAIAGQLQLSRLTVKKHMAEALKSIRKYLRQHLSAFFL